MKVVAVTTWFPTQVAPTSGTFTHADIQAIKTRREVSDIRVVHLVPPHTDDGTRRLTYQGLDVVRIPMSTRSPAQIWRAGQALRREVRGADLVHTMAFSTLLAMAWWRPRAPWVHTEHWSALTTPSTVPLTWRLALPLLWPLVRRPDVVTAVCDYLARPIRKRRGNTPTEVIPCIVPPPEHLDARPIRPRNPTRLVAVGGLVDRKDPLIAVDTVAELARRGTPARLTWVGEGPLREKVLRRARKKKVAHLVRLPGSTDAEGVRAALANADLFFLPTKGDNFCVSCAEALVAGRPVVVGATGGQGEYIDPRVGALVSEQKPEVYADAISAVEQRTRHLNASDVAATIGDRFAADRVAEQYAAVYAWAAGRG